MADKTTKKTKTNHSLRNTATKKNVESEKDLRYRVRRRLHNANVRRKKFLSRRPHRSFRVTKRRDYKRSLKLPGYWSLTKRVFSMIFKNKRVFFSLAFLYAALTFLLSSIMSQDTYSQLKDLVDQAGQEGGLGGVAGTLTIFWGVLTSQLLGTTSGNAGSSQQIFSVLLGLFTWLSTVWLLRGMMSGRKLRMRDGVYSSGGPVIALLFLVFVLLIQILPAAIALIVYSAADTSGLLSQTAMLMLFGGGAILLAVLSVYWITSTLIAMVIVALPGMYPMQALKLAGDVVIGRRIRILLRFLWLVVILLLAWAVVLIPVILIDGALKSAIPGLSWLPLVPLVALFLMSFSIVISAAYVYIFYRKVVEDDSAPA